ncbi:MAG: SDR family NAD(P)-dependent oxidoreductase [Bacteroidota bacterium]
MKKTILITGSTDGIGKLAAIRFAKEGHELYLHGRNSEKLAQVIEEIKTLSANPDIDGFVADFSDLSAVRQMTEAVIGKLAKLDVLINNAGVYKSAAQLNQDGLDIRFVVNYFAPYIQTHALIPLLRKGTEPRVLNLSSAAQSLISWKALTGQEHLSERATYAQSKLAITMWSFHLARTVPDISVIAVNPGSLLNTNMVREAFGHHWSSADKGADILYDLALSEAYKGITGKYFDNDSGDFGGAHQDAHKETVIEQLIRTTETIVRLP